MSDNGNIALATTPPVRSPRRPLKRPDRRSGPPIPIDLYLAIALLAIFALLHNGSWSRGGDSDVYLSMARNLALGKGYRFNNQPVAVVTPVWPYVLAGAMRYISPSFNFLKLLPMLFITGGLLMWYRILLRLIDRKLAAVCVLLSAILMPMATLSYVFHTESLFTLVVSAAILIALQINEAKSVWWRLPALLTLCALSVGVRWAGLLCWPIVAGALLREQPLWPWPRLLERRWLAAITSLVIMLGTFIALRHALKVPPEMIDPNYDDSLAVSYSLFNKTPTFGEYARRIAWTGQWLSGLLWQPLTEAGRLARMAMNVVGFALVAAALSQTKQIIRRREWLVVGAAAYLGWLIIDWPAPVARYLVPFAPLVLATLYTCVRDAMASIRNESLHRLARTATLVAVAGVLKVNLAFYLIEVYIAQKPNYYSTYQAGSSQSLIDAAHFLEQLNLPEGKIVLSRADTNFSRTKWGNQWLRAANLLTNRGIRSAPQIYCREPDAAMVEWMEFVDAEWFLYRPPSMTMWHFDARRLPILGPMMHLPPPQTGDTDWQLYQIKNHAAKRIFPSPARDWPRRVPGMEAGR